jgi:hypothetical protein
MNKALYRRLINVAIFNESVQLFRLANRFDKEYVTQDYAKATATINTAIDVVLKLQTGKELDIYLPLTDLLTATK